MFIDLLNEAAFCPNTRFNTCCKSKLCRKVLAAGYNSAVSSLSEIGILVSDRLLAKQPTLIR